MYRTNSPLALAISAFLVLSFLSTHSLLAQEKIPDTPAGKRMGELLDAVNDSSATVRSDFFKAGFAESDNDTVKERMKRTDQLRSQLGELAFIKAFRSTDHEISALCNTTAGAKVILSIDVTEKKPYKIETIRLEMSSNGEAPDTSPIDADARSEIIERLAKELRSKYVFPKVAEEMAVAIETSLSEGDYDEIENVDKMATNLTNQLREICHDKHLRIRAGTIPVRGSQPGRRPADNHGFVKAEMLPGGIGYLKFDFFSGSREAQKTASAAMNFLGNSNSLIFDLRQNGGGSPKMIAYLTSYLFDEPVHLNSFYNRPTETTTETWTQKDVPGKKFSSSIPVYVLTSSRTFSGAEEFSYNLKNLKRGILVGETTGGGAHPVMPVSLGSRCYITMPFARAINPITNTNWEGTGVKPDVDVSADVALEKAIELIRNRSTEVAASDSADMKKTETANVDTGELFQKAGELMARESFGDAAQLFEKIIKHDPENSRAWFNYGYCLHGNGDLDKAIEVHKKAAEFDQFAGIATYNLACAYSLKGETDLAFSTLDKAIGLGFGDANQVEGDSDFDNLRQDKRYDELMKRLQDKR